MFVYRILHTRSNKVIVEGMSWGETVELVRQLNGNVEENKTYVVLREKTKLPIQVRSSLVFEIQGEPATLDE